MEMLKEVHQRVEIMIKNELRKLILATLVQGSMRLAFTEYDYIQWGWDDLKWVLENHKWIIVSTGE
jgi:hypothetical protein